GFTWTETRIPRSNTLGSVAAGAPNAAWTTDGGILQWNGSVWIRPSYYVPLNSDGGYYGVTTTSASNAWAIGSFTQYYDYGFGVVLHWNGQAWGEIVAPLPKGAAPARKQAPTGGCYVIDSFQRIDAVGSNDAWLTGQHTTNCTPNSDYDFVEHCTATGC